MIRGKSMSDLINRQEIDAHIKTIKGAGK